MIQSPLKKKKNKIYEIFSDQFEIDGNQLIQINFRKIITDLNLMHFYEQITTKTLHIAYKNE